MSTFGVARLGFGGSGRQKSHIYHGFCLLSVSRTSVSKGQVDKNQTSALVLLLDVLIHENENSLFFLASIIAVNCRAYAKKSDDLQLIANHPVFQFED